MYITNSDLFVPALFETFGFSFRRNIFSGPWSKTLCVLSHSGFLQFFFSSRTFPETMIAIEASEAKFLFSYVFCSLSSIFFLENGTVPPCVTIFTQNARRKIRRILCFTSNLGICCKNFGCFWLNLFLVP